MGEDFGTGGRPIANLSGNGKVRRRRVWLPVGHALV
jgi:hypothetical protein